MDAVAALVAAASIAEGPIDWFTCRTIPAELPPAVASRVRLHLVSAAQTPRITRGLIRTTESGRCDVDIDVSAPNVADSTLGLT